MTTARKSSQYLQHYAETEARHISLQPTARTYDECLIIPAYAEPPELIERWQSLTHCAHSILIILVLNYPADNDSAASINSEPAGADTNAALRATLTALPPKEVLPGVGKLYFLFENTDILLVERAHGLPADQGVGLARKIGADIACSLKSAQRLRSRWLHCTDADATLPGDYFSQCDKQSQQVTAVCHPFRHMHETATSSNAAQLYELRLHYYVRGLRRAGSPYAYQTLGSCISIDTEAYQQVRGFPRRAAAEDFYLLNKLAKLGPVVDGVGAPIVLDARPSQRVPFGTGPAVAALQAEANPLQKPLFYNPRSFLALGAILDVVPTLYNHPEPVQLIHDALANFDAAANVIEAMGLQRCVRHCQQHSGTSEGFSRHFHQWFDGFRTLKFIHGLRTAGYQDLTLTESLQQKENIWPQATDRDWTLQQLLDTCAAQ
ncbi:hypothetical protein EYC98_20480 [Halieaceae bacterium IMCC14734]|uniref:Uncharacterized protein n=1 Tax=Candidatus Litorirhabdus singularis TaxID=2518993 RepID=A0ABT3TLP1_9GAMM|nr:hypothetical protein [Candidatus Litorirhabdus singularis]MCX2983246.1 hypothetical protein [Candidatus Litorirhabdus singularis]